jgi:hypothetical protein
VEDAEYQRGATLFRLRAAPCMIPPKPWTPRLMVYADEIASAAFAGSTFAGDTDLLVIRAAAREWLIDGQSGVLIADQPPSGIETVALASRTSDGWSVEVVRFEKHDLAVLVAPGASLFTGPFPGWAVVTPVYGVPSALGWGFSPSGRALVLVARGMVWSYVRSPDESER